jgi:hypothetical protein
LTIHRRQIIATGKYYIGKHKGGDKYYKGSGKEYKQDLKIYKEYNTEILEYVDDISKLNEREEWWLNQVDAVNNPLYYNKTNKSFGPVNQTQDWKINQSNRMKGKSTTKDKKWKVQDTSNMKGGGTKGKTWRWKTPRTEEQNRKIWRSCAWGWSWMRLPITAFHLSTGRSLRRRLVPRRSTIFALVLTWLR